MATEIPQPSPPITIEQYEGFEGFPGLRDELINGAIVLSPQPKPLHQQVSENTAALLNKLRTAEYVAKQNSNIKFRNANSMPAPDVFVVSREDWKTACELGQYLDVAPLLVVEIISPANRKNRVAQKIELYLSNQVTAVWAVHPKQRVLRTYTMEGRLELSEADTVTLPAPLTGEIKVRDMLAIS